MDIDLTRLSQANLEIILRKAEQDLQTALLGGKSWMDVKYLRDYIIEINVTKYRNAFPHDDSGITQIRNKLHQHRGIESLVE